jgi:hypothetical protein
MPTLSERLGRRPARQAGGMELISVSVDERCHIDRRVEDVWADLREFGNGVGLRSDGTCSVTLLARAPTPWPRPCARARAAGARRLPLPACGGG